MVDAMTHTPETPPNGGVPAPLPLRLSVQAALARVMAELPAIGKDGRASQSQGGYAYRGIEQITREAQQLFARHGVVIVPGVTSITTKDVTVANRPWTDTTLVVNYLVVGPDGSQLEATTVGIGRDNSDKGANKAMTQAYKYLLLQLLCISDAKDDGDGHTHEADERAEPHPNDERVRKVFDELRRMTATQQAALREWADGRSLSGASMIRDEVWLEAVEAWLDEYTAGGDTATPDDAYEGAS